MVKVHNIIILKHLPEQVQKCQCMCLKSGLIDRLGLVMSCLIGVLWILLFPQNPVDPCPGVSGNITQYQISYQTESVVVTESVNTAECTAWSCSHSLELPSNPPSSYGNISVAAENVVGLGAARTCSTQTISEFELSQDCVQINCQGNYHVCIV